MQTFCQVGCYHKKANKLQKLFHFVENALQDTKFFKNNSIPSFQKFYLGMTKRARLTLLGFCLFMLGATELVLNIVGLKFGFLAWLDVLGGVGALLVKLSLIFGGIVLTVLVNTDENAPDEYLDESK